MLSAISSDEDGLGISELSRRIGVSKSTAHLTVQTLLKMQFIQLHPENGRYILGLASLQLGARGIRTSSLVAALAEPMRALADASQEAVSLSVRIAGELLIVRRFETVHPLRTSVQEGSRLPLYATAGGKCLLAAATVEEVVELFPSKQLPKLGPNSVEDRDSLLNELASIQKHGYAIVEDEFLNGVCSAAVPVVVGGVTLAAVSLAGPTSRLQPQVWVDALRAIADPSLQLNAGAEHGHNPTAAATTGDPLS